MVFRNDVGKNEIMSFCLEKLNQNDKMMYKFFKSILRNGDQKQGLQDFIDEVLSDKKDLIGIELGSYCGNSSEMFINSGCFEKLYCIDSWNGIESKFTEKIFDETLSKNQKIIKIKDLTLNVSKQFQYGSIDFIYIDANHDYDSVKNDILHYFPKIKNGGIISGHDYCESWKGVINAVNEIFGKPIKVFKDGSWYIIK